MAAIVVERVSMSEHDALSVLAELSSRTPSPTSTDPQLTEVPLPSNIFLANPLALLISPPQATQEPFFLVESEAHNCVLSIAERLSKPYEVDSLTVLYSPTFKCYTSIVFYAAVFTELRRLCATIDESGKVSPAARATVWAHLYTLIGADKPLNSSSLTPALNAMAADADKLNLVEIEVLLLAFLLSLHANRHLLSASSSQEMPDAAVLKQQATKITMEFIHFFRFKTALGLKEALVANSRLLRPVQPPTSAALRSSASNSTRNTIPDLLSQTDIDNISCLQMLSMLRAWAPALERLNPAVRSSIWKSCRNIPSLKRYYTPEASSASFSGAVAAWMRAPVVNQSSISGLFGAVCLMHEAKCLSDEFRVDPTNMSKNLRDLIQVLVSAPSPSSTPPPMYPPSSSPLNFSPVPPQLHGPRMVGGPGVYPMSMSPVMVSPSPPPMMMGPRSASPLMAMPSSPLHHHMSAQAMVSAMGLGFIPPPNTAIRPPTAAMGVPAGFIRPQPRAAASPLMNPAAPVQPVPSDPVEPNGSAAKKRKLADSDAAEALPAPKSPKVDESSSPRNILSTSNNGAAANPSMNISSMLS
eukprot:TRINITY_DN5725_c0_g1_i1.p1 TRINITY_DN5725_c0_g1~~TRINITY_DN5725_c0_g1_i1.p1  ORF type:complete len:584 (-),score=74.20 TRINITY_DN5725_c0_g1_i1:69-1820(-)